MAYLLCAYKLSPELFCLQSIAFFTPVDFAYMFTEDESEPTRKKKVLREVVSALYRFAHHRAHRVVFLNPDDLNDFSHWKIVDAKKARDLVLYSFRHYFITKRVNTNVPIALIAEMCDTSISQIEKTYYHTTEDKMVSNALADYEYIDGLLVPK